jgi:hypothetical protein
MVMKIFLPYSPFPSRDGYGAVYLLYCTTSLTVSTG